MEKYYIYLTTNLINNKKYIGKHKGYLDDNYLGSGILITAAINKYGKENFKKEILYVSKSEEENNEKEKYFIALYNAVERKDFYNIADGGQGGYVTKGYTSSQRDAVNKKISKKNAGKNHPMYGKHHTEETKDLLRKKSLKYWTQERRNERSKKYSGSGNPMYGKHHSKESIQKKVAHTDYSFTQTKEYREKMSEIQKGIKNGNYGNKGDKAKNGVHIKMYDKNNNLIKEFNTKRMALEYLGIKSHDGLDRAIKNHTLYKKYYWIQT